MRNISRTSIGSTQTPAEETIFLEKDDVEYRDQRRKKIFEKITDAKNAEDWEQLANEKSERIKQGELVLS